MNEEMWLALYVNKKRRDIAVPQDAIQRIYELLTKEDLEILDKDAKSKGIGVRGLILYGTRGLHKAGYYRRKIKFSTAKELREKLLQLHTELIKC